MSEKRFIGDLDNERFRFKELPNTTIRIWDTLTNQQYFVNGMTPDSGWKFCTMFRYLFLETEKLRKENEQLKADHKRQGNQIKLLNKQLTKIPPKIREVWIE